MQPIEALLLEPVGCLAEFPSAPFHEISIRLFGRKGKSLASASRTYWRLLNLMDASKTQLDAEQKSLAETLEVEAVEAASLYEDVVPALVELKSMGIGIFVASSLSRRATARFMERNSLGEYFSGICTRRCRRRKVCAAHPRAQRRFFRSGEDDVPHGYVGGNQDRAQRWCYSYPDDERP
jgi:phosphoglycolate phosphatase-like HAD superfamily hydrolase